MYDLPFMEYLLKILVKKILTNVMSKGQGLKANCETGIRYLALVFIFSVRISWSNPKTVFSWKSRLVGSQCKY